MQKNTSITLGEHFENFIASQIESGQYATASETVRAGLRLLEERQENRQTKLAALSRVVVTGEEIDRVENGSFDGLMKELDEE